LWLITNILLPFTAPFRTYDLTPSSNQRAGDTLFKDKLDSDDKVALGDDRPILAPAWAPVVHASVAANQVTARRVIVTVLRI
jgi:hypothetical protein